MTLDEALAELRLLRVRLEDSRACHNCRYWQADETTDEDGFGWCFLIEDAVADSDAACRSFVAGGAP